MKAAIVPTAFTGAVQRTSCPGARIRRASDACGPRVVHTEPFHFWTVPAVPPLTINPTALESMSAAAVADLSIDWLITNGLLRTAPMTRADGFCVGESLTAWIRIWVVAECCNWPSDTEMMRDRVKVLLNAEVYWTLLGCRT